MKYMKIGQAVSVEFPNGWQDGWTITGRVADTHRDMEGRQFRYRYNVHHSDGREILEIHPLCARAV